MIIYVKFLTGHTLSLRMHANHTIKEAKDMLHARDSAVDPSLQCMIYAGRQLDDSKTLAEYGIIHESKLHIVLRLRGPSSMLEPRHITVQFSTGSVVALSVTSTSTIMGVKEELAQD